VNHLLTEDINIFTEAQISNIFTNVMALEWSMYVISYDIYIYWRRKIMMCVMQREAPRIDPWGTRVLLFSSMGRPSNQQ
jgi:hypothetical protein